MKRGFIPLVVIALIGLVGALVSGGAYTVYKVNQLQEENETIKLQVQEQNQQLEQQVEGSTTIQEQLEVQNDASITEDIVVKNAQVEPVVDNEDIKKIVQQVSEIKNTEPVVSVPNNPVVEPTLASTGTYCNGKYWGVCPAGQALICPNSPGNAYCSIPQNGINYRNDVIIQLNQTIAVYESFKDWLQDCSDDLRKEKLALNSYPRSNLSSALMNYIDSELGRLSKMITLQNEEIAEGKSLLSTLEASPDLFVDKATFDNAQGLDSIKEDIEATKKLVNSDLKEISEGFQSLNTPVY